MLCCALKSLQSCCGLFCNFILFYNSTVSNDYGHEYKRRHGSYYLKTFNIFLVPVQWEQNLHTKIQLPELGKSGLEKVDFPFELDFFLDPDRRTKAVAIVFSISKQTKILDQIEKLFFFLKQIYMAQIKVLLTGVV